MPRSFNFLVLLTFILILIPSSNGASGRGGRRINVARGGSSGSEHAGSPGFGETDAGSSSSSRSGRGEASSSGRVGHIISDAERERILEGLIRDYAKSTSLVEYRKYYNSAVDMQIRIGHENVVIPNKSIEILKELLSKPGISKSQLKLKVNEMIANRSAVKMINDYCANYLNNTMNEIKENCLKKMTGFVFKEDKANNITHCTFCQREFVEDEAIVKNTCGHYYHYECFEGKKNCPSCHSPLKLITNKDASALNEKLKLFDLGLEDKLCF